MKKLILIPIALIVLVSLACSLSVNVPSITTTTPKTVSIDQDYPANAQSAALTIEMGGGKLDIQPGAAKWVEGSVTYNVTAWEPVISASDDGLKISQKSTSNVGIPTGDIKNDWALKIGSQPTSLKVSAGAYQGVLDLSGLSLSNLEINDGASQATVRFNSANPIQMQQFTYKTGASDVTLDGLANANTSSINFSSGAGNYTLDFSGTLQQDVNVRISSGLSQVKIIVPKGIHCVVNLGSGVSNIDPQGTWTVSGTQYEAAGTGFTIHVDVDMALGNLVLQQE